MLKLAEIFQDHMVLQRGKPIRVWGTAGPFSAVQAVMGADKAAVRADAEGAWLLELPAREAGTGYSLGVEAGQERIELCDINIGEVWLAGGQSNMEYHMMFDRDYNAVLEAGAFRDIRFFDVPELAYEGELEDYDYSEVGFWRQTSREDLRYFSAVAYYFADRIGEALDVPIGIIGCNWGGTTAMSWTDPKYLEGTEGEIWLREYEDFISHLDPAAYEAGFQANPMNDRTTMLKDPMNIRIMRDGLSRDEQAVFLQQIQAMMGVEPNGDATPDMLNYGPKSEQNPGTLYRHMLCTVAPYSIRGVIWYQGESDDRYPEVYAAVLSRMIRCWRDLWNEELPFLFVQLAPFERWLMTNGRAYPLLRRQQELVSKTVPNTWMATSGDAGMQWDIHPKCKRPIGTRLGLLALGHVYGKELLCDAPELVSAEAKDGDLRLRFANAEGLYRDGELSGILELLDGEGKRVSVSEADVSGDTLILRGCGSTATVRYAQLPYFRACLFNAAGIPAKPFEAHTVRE